MIAGLVHIQLVQLVPIGCVTFYPLCRFWRWPAAVVYMDSPKLTEAAHPNSVVRLDGRNIGHRSKPWSLVTRIGSRAYVAMGCDSKHRSKACPNATPDQRSSICRDNHRGYSAIGVANTQLPPNANVALLFQADTHISKRKTMLGGVTRIISPSVTSYFNTRNSLNVLRELSAPHIAIKQAVLRKNTHS